MDVVQFGRFAIGVEIASRVVGTGEHGELDLSDITQRQGAGATDRGHVMTNSKAVVIDGIRAQAADINLDRVVLLCAGQRNAGANQATETGIERNFPQDGNDTAPLAGDAGPDDDFARKGIATGDAVFETDLVAMVVMGS